MQKGILLPCRESILDLFEDCPRFGIIDLSMPKTSGIEPYRKLRKISQIPIIVLFAKGAEKIKVVSLDSERMIVSQDFS